MCLHLIARLFFSENLIFKKVGITSYFCLFFKGDNNHAQKGQIIKNIYSIINRAKQMYS